MAYRFYYYYEHLVFADAYARVELIETSSQVARVEPSPNSLSYLEKEGEKEKRLLSQNRKAAISQNYPDLAKTEMSKMHSLNWNSYMKKKII